MKIRGVIRGVPLLMVVGMYVCCAIGLSEMRPSEPAQASSSSWRSEGYFIPNTDLPNALTYLVFGCDSDDHGGAWILDTDDVVFRVTDHLGRVSSRGPFLKTAPGTPRSVAPHRLRDDGQDTWRAKLPLILDHADGRPGMYTVRASVRLRTRDPKTHRTVFSGWVIGETDTYLAPKPDKPPALEPGQRFIATTWSGEGRPDGADSAYRSTRTDKVVLWKVISTRVLVLKHIEHRLMRGTRYVFSVEDLPDDVYIDGDHTVTTLPDLTPLVEDDTVRAMRTQYVGKRVWWNEGTVLAFGRFGPDAIASTPVQKPTSDTVRRVERLYRCGEIMEYGGSCTESYSTSNPLFVAFDSPLDDRSQSYAVFADRWDFERRCGLRLPWEEHPEWPKKMVDAMKRGALLKGMTPEMVVWSCGWPTMYGGIDELSKVDYWVYPGGPAREPYLVFEKGRLIHVHDSPNI